VPSWISLESLLLLNSPLIPNPRLAQVDISVYSQNFRSAFEHTYSCRHSATMHFLKSRTALASTLALASLLTGAVSSPIDTAVVSPRDDNTPETLFKRALCSGTGPGVCNVGYSLWNYPGQPEFNSISTVQVFNRYCQVSR
jgi:hypothetical protein